MKSKDLLPRFNLISALAAGVLMLGAGFYWTGMAAVDQKVVSVHYLLLFLTAFFAFTTPYFLFPDQNSRMIQVANFSSSKLQRYIASRWISLCWPLFFLFFVMMMADRVTLSCFIPDKLMTFFAASLYLMALSLFSIVKYIHSGEKSRFWKESEKGRRIRNVAADVLKYPLDPGSVPTLINTIMILSAGSVVVLTGFVLNQAYGSHVELIWFMMVLAITWIYAGRRSGELLRSFYSGNAFFAEFFGSNMKEGDSLAVRREVDQLWWVPGILKPHVWQFMVQLDRQIPAGRVVAAGHVLIWFIAYQRPEADSMAAMWILFALLHHLFLFFTFREEMSPVWLHRWLAGPFTWYFSRVWLQLRWILPLLASMNVQLFIFGLPDYRAQFILIVVYMATALLIPLIGLRSGQLNDSTS